MHFLSPTILATCPAHRSVLAADIFLSALFSWSFRKVTDHASYPYVKLCLAKHYFMKYVGVEAWLQALLTSAPDGGGWSASRPGLITPGVKAPTTHWIGSCVDPTAGLDGVPKRRKSLPLPGIEPRSSSP